MFFFCKFQTHQKRNYLYAKINLCRSFFSNIMYFKTINLFITNVQKSFYDVNTLKSFTGCTIPMISDGDSSPTGNITSGQNVTFSCSMGFSLNGSATVTCQNDGTFSSTIPNCARSKSSTIYTA